MTFSHVFGIIGLVAVVAFIVFAFRQGMKVKPSGRSGSSTIAGESDTSHGGGGHGGGGHGGAGAGGGD